MVSESLARYEPKDSTLNIMITGLSKVGINKNYLIYDKTQYIDYIGYLNNYSIRYILSECYYFRSLNVEVLMILPHFFWK